jgi:hypothetical protein
VTHFADPETYLRLACERLLLTDGQGNGAQDGPQVSVIGRALIAAGTLEEDRARSVLQEYGVATMLRNQRGLRHMHLMFREPVAGKRLSAQRVAVCDQEFGDGDLGRTLEQVVFADDAAYLNLSGIMPPGAGGGGAFMGRITMVRGFGGGRPPGHALSVSDDRGTVASATAGGWGSGGQVWNARFTTNVPLSADTRWLEIDGARLDLPPRQPSPAVRVESVARDDPLRSMLHQEILGTGHRHGPQGLLEVAIDALLATGRLEDADPMLAEIRRIAAAFTGGAPGPNLPEPWASLTRRFAQSDGPVGTCAIGAAVNSVDGYSIRFDTLRSQEDSFTLDVAVSPGLPLLMRFPGFDLQRSPLDWWAEDDRKNVYLCANGGGGGSSELAQGTVHSLAPLDPEATELRLLPTGTQERAVVTLGLGQLRGPS